MLKEQYTIIGYFRTFTEWVNKTSSRIGGYPPNKIFCYDTKGRMLRNGKDFMTARDEGAFPVEIRRMKD